ncbi:MAG: QueT transporter family protein [Fervidicoccaceae archaeon]
MKLKDAVEISLIAGGYAALTIMVAPIAYGPIQARISDILLSLPFSRRFGLKGVIGLTVGAFLSNLASPYGAYDMVLGTLANFTSSLLVYASRKLPFPLRISLVTGIALGIAAVDFIIGYVLLGLIYQVPLLYGMGGVAIGEILTFGIGGYLLATGLEKRYGEGAERNDYGASQSEGKAER